jgi:hypothetical protein
MNERLTISGTTGLRYGAPPALFELENLLPHRQQGPLDTVPVVVTYRSYDAAVLLFPQFPAMPAGFPDGKASYVSRLREFPGEHLILLH